jgi:pimeloyl-ACP methyl ester carboxylesterase
LALLFWQRSSRPVWEGATSEAFHVLGESALSSKGELAAYVVYDNRDARLMVQNVATGVSRTVFSGKDTTIKGLGFSLDGRALYFAKDNHNEKEFRLLRVRLTADAQPVGNPAILVSAYWGVDPIGLYGTRYYYFDRDQTRVAYYDLLKGNRILTEYTDKAIWIDALGKPVMTFGHPSAEVLSLKSIPGTSQILEFSAYNRYFGKRRLMDGLLVGVFSRAGESQLLGISQKTLQTKILATSKDAEIADWLALNGSLAAYATENPLDRSLTWQGLTPAGRVLVSALDNYFEDLGRDYLVDSVCRNTLILRGISADQKDALYTAAFKLNLDGAPSADLADRLIIKPLASVEADADLASAVVPISVRTNFSIEMEGHRVTGYVSKPKAGWNGWTVLWCPDIPFERTPLGFDPVSHDFNAAGYAVLRVDIAGTAGTGESTFMAYQQAGVDSAAEDLNRTLHDVSEAGLIDADQLVIGGQGFGGYLSFYTAQRDKETFSALFALNPLHDILDPTLMPRYSTEDFAFLFDAYQTNEKAYYDKIQMYGKIRDIGLPMAIAFDDNDLSILTHKWSRLEFEIASRPQPVKMGDTGYRLDAEDLNFFIDFLNKMRLGE